MPLCFRWRSPRCDARQRIQSGSAQWKPSQRPEKTFTKRPHMPRFSCFEYYLHVCMCLFLCVCVCGWVCECMHERERAWERIRECVCKWVIALNWVELKQPDRLIYPGRNRHASADKRVYDRRHNFFFQMSVKLNGFQDTLQNASILINAWCQWHSKK